MKFLRRTEKDVKTYNKLKDLFPDWKENERWLFIGPHDDDIVLGSGITMRAAIEAGIEVYALVSTDGGMGYCHLEQEHTIGQIRQKETVDSFKIIGLDDAHIFFANFPDCDTTSYVGRRKAKAGDPAIEGYTGLQNAFTYYIRKVKPTRIFLPTGADLHPDHKIVYQEVLISMFHAGGNIWPELGDPADTPMAYEFGVYCDFPSEPNLKFEADPEVFQKKLDAILAYKSQEQIASLVEGVKQGGPLEYIREISFRFYSVNNYKELF
ncbi:MAG: PIG-L deacetylase family protein [Candidatus Neomarinimicrobiota bacterium]|jgi:LmbE family N-acetylglucosaminyl deacetylase|nr:PIG-L family deacetylase [Candidatus Neomarinimicrobiota bacterium]